MKQLIELLETRIVDTESLLPIPVPLSEKIIINNPQNIETSNLTLDSTSLIQIENVNFIFLVSKSNQNFNLEIINDNGNLEIQACQFNYQNAYTPISLVLTNPNLSSINITKLTVTYSLT